MRAIPLANHLSQQQLQERIRSTKDAALRDKYRAILWLSQGERRKEVAKRLGITLKTLWQWVVRYNEEGEEGLKRKKGQGRKRVLDERRMEMIKEWISKEGGVWTLEKMALRLKEEEGIEVTPQAIWYRLKEERWSWKTARPYNPKRDKGKEEAFKKGGYLRQQEKEGE